MGVQVTALPPRRRKRIVAAALAGSLVATMAAFALAPEGSNASSHREAPFIATDPTADGTDVYAFVSPDDPDTVTLIANYIPLEEPAGGPNFHAFGDDVRYQIHVDNDGDAKPDISYQFQFETTVGNGDSFLYNTFPVDSATDPDLNVKQTYSVSLVEDGKRTRLGRDVPVAPANVGPRSTPDYGAITDSAIANLPGGINTFAGPRDDPFFVDLGSVFDLGGLRPFNPAHVIPRNTEAGVDGLRGYNVHSIAIQVPKNQLTADGGPADDPTDPNSIVGVWTTAERKSTRVLRSNGTMRQQGPWVQVSRLGVPLINEVMIPLKDKNKWNSSVPSKDGQFFQYVKDPELGRLIPVLYPGVTVPPAPRTDLLTVVFAGITNLNQPANVVPSEQLRLNMAIPPTPVADQNRLGLLAGQTDGFPNGRRLGDDVTDILLRAIAGGYAFTPDFDVAPNNQLGDGVDTNDVPFMSTFPYLATPHQGYASIPHGVTGP